MLPFGGFLRAFARRAFGSRSNPIPPPPRITSLSLNIFGLHAKPSCGAQLLKLLLVRFFRTSILDPAKLPVGPNIRFPKRPLSAVIGENHSQRRPKFSVRFGRNFQSSCTKNPKSPVWKVVLLGTGL